MKTITETLDSFNKHAHRAMLGVQRELASQATRQRAVMALSKPTRISQYAFDSANRIKAAYSHQQDRLDAQNNAPQELPNL